MNFKSKIKIRIAAGIFLAAIGIAIIAIGNVTQSDAELLHSFGAVYAVMGIMRVISYTRLIRDEGAMRQREIAENDERTVYITMKACTLAFSIYGVGASAVITALFLIGKTSEASVVAYCILGFMLIYLLCRTIIAKKS